MKNNKIRGLRLSGFNLVEATQSIVQQYSIGPKDKQMTETQSRNINKCVVNWFSAKMPRQIIGKTILFSTNGAGKIDIHMENIS